MDPAPGIGSSSFFYGSSYPSPFHDLQLTIGGKSNCFNILQSFEHYTQKESLTGQNKYDSGKNYGYQDAEKSIQFETLPKVLNLQLKKFEFNAVTNQLTKVKQRYIYYNELDLSKFVNDKSIAYHYTLFAVLVHQGATLHSGNYYTYINVAHGLNKQKQWLKFDDDKVTKANENEVLGAIDGISTAYMLIYIRHDAIDEMIGSLSPSSFTTTASTGNDKVLIPNFTAKKNNLQESSSVEVKKENDLILIDESKILPIPLRKHFITEKEKKNSMCQIL
jgi:uncharacterized UBP type Zn finger protein/antitoxin component of MazEF toxin-antitoxin module